MHDRKEGLIVIVVSIAFGCIALVLSKGWGTAYPLFLFEFPIENDVGITEHFVVYTSYVIVAIILLLTYGVLRYLSAIPSIFPRGKGTNKVSDIEKAP